MTNKDAINTLNEMWERLFAEMRGWIFEDLKKEGKLDTFKEAHNMSIKALEQQPILDKIRADIEIHCGLIKENHCRFCSYCNCVMGVREILEIIDKYKGESEKDNADSD